MKTLYSGMALLLSVVIMVGCFASCKTTDPVSSTEPSSETKVSNGMENEGATVTFLSNGFDNSNTDDPIYKGIKRFEQETGKKVEVIQSGNLAWSDKVIASIGSGAPIDVFNSYIQNFLTFYQEDFIVPLDDYVSLQGDIFDKAMMDRYAKFDGKYYAAGGAAVPYVLFYNKKLLSDNGFDENEPRDLYDAGNWTWAEFKRIAGECHDPDNGINGFENMYNEIFLASNDVSVVTFENNRYALRMDSPALKQSLETIQDVFFTNRIAGNGWLDGQANFVKGKAAFHGTYSYDEVTFLKSKESGELRFEFGMVPFPVGPSNTRGASMIHATGMCISTGSKVPYSAGRLIECILQETATTENAAARLPGSTEIYKKLRENPACPNYTDGVLNKDFASFYMLNDVFSGKDITQTLQGFTDIYQAEVDKANARLTQK